MVQSLGQLLVQHGVRNLDRQLPTVADHLGYFTALAMPVPTRHTHRPVDWDRLLLLEG